MIDINVQYQLILFTNADDIIATPQVVSSLLEIFQDKSLIPSTFIELSTAQPQTRVKLSTTDEEWGILFPTNKIDVQKTLTDPKGGNLGELSQFVEEATELAGRILNKFKMRAKRLAIVTNSLLQEMNEGQMATAYLKLFNPLQFYKEYKPFEWNYRSAAHIERKVADLDENFNVIAGLKRVKARIGTLTEITQLDRIQLSLDINTVPGNKESRFELDHIKSFCQSALELHGTLSKQIQEHIDVGSIISKGE